MKRYSETSKLIAVLSDNIDGSMKQAGNTGEIIQGNVDAFLKTIGIHADSAVRVRLDYDSEHFTRYSVVDQNDKGDGITKPSSVVSDALFTKSHDVALFLPLADCIGAVLYDADNEVLGVSHLGRHNLVQNGGFESVRYMRKTFDTNPANVRVYLTAAAGKKHYPMFDFGGKSLHEVALAQLRQAGISSGNILVDERDTTTDPELYSHSEALKGAVIKEGRHAVVAMMRS